MLLVLIYLKTTFDYLDKQLEKITIPYAFFKQDNKTFNT